MDEFRGPAVQIELPKPEAAAPLRIGRRLLLAIALIAFVALVAWIGGGHVDPEDDDVSLLDAFYYATVSITTTGYGDIRPVTDEARLLTTVLITPARILFLILLVGTTLEVLTQRTREAYRLARWRRTLKDHVVICGFGTKGRSAGMALLGRGLQPQDIVVIDSNEDARGQATSVGFAAVAGDAARTDVLRAADVHEAKSVIVAADRDDAAVLITLTARELNPDATIAAAVREEENAHLLRQSGADSVITSSGAAGRLLGVATQTPRVVDVFEDLLSVGEGLDILQRPVEDRECGPAGSAHSPDPIVAVLRDGELIRFDDDRATTLVPGDELIYLCSNRN
jgi:voltage-gated potassium channel